MVTPTPSRDPSPTRGTTTQTIVLCIQFNFIALSQVQLNQVQLTQVQLTLVQLTQVQSDIEDKDFIEVLAPKRKQGRPTTKAGLAKVSRDIQDIQFTFQNTGLESVSQESPASKLAGYSSQETQNLGQQCSMSEATS